MQIDGHVTQRIAFGPGANMNILMDLGPQRDELSVRAAVYLRDPADWRPE